MSMVSQRCNLRLFVLSGVLLGTSACTLHVHIGRSSAPVAPIANEEPSAPQSATSSQTIVQRSPPSRTNHSDPSVITTFFAVGRAGSTTHLDGGVSRKRDSNDFYDGVAGIGFSPILTTNTIVQGAIWAGTDFSGVNSDGRAPGMAGAEFVAYDPLDTEKKVSTSFDDWMFLGKIGYSESRYLVVNGEAYLSLLHLSAGRDADSQYYGLGLGTFCSTRILNKTAKHFISIDRNTCVLENGSRTIGAHFQLISDVEVRSFFTVGVDLDYQRHAIDLQEARREHTWTGGLRMGFRF